MLILTLWAMALAGMAQSSIITHVVERGETLESIASKYGISVDEIKRANPNANGMVYAGMKLNIPANKKQPAADSSDQRAGQEPAEPKTTSILTTSVPAKTELKQESRYTGFTFVMDILGIGFLQKAKEEKGFSGHKLNFVYASSGINYYFTPKFYVGARIGWSTFDYTLKLKGYSIGVNREYHFLEIPIETGYAIRSIDEKFAVIPFVSLAGNIGISGKDKVSYSGESVTEDAKIGGELGLESRIGVRLDFWNLNISVAYRFPLNKEQKDWFGKKAFPEISFGGSF